tara:strand:+ start:364 stop:1260 length:897 start_codon:yes stop_codon:yes gene_type:complete
MASTILVNTIDTQSGTAITVPTGKTLAITDAGALTIGGTAITTGAQGVISKTATYTILAADFTGKSSLMVLVNASSGTSTEIVITLPAASAFGTCAIHVVSTAAHGSGNYITIKNSSAVEQYTLFGIGDHCELVSDGTTVFRTGNEFVTVKGFVHRTSNFTITGNVTTPLFTTGVFTERYNIGSWFTSANHCVIIPWACRILLESLTFVDSTANQGGTPAIRYYTTGRSSNDWIFYTNDKINDPVSNLTPTIIHDFDAGDEIEFNVFNLMVGTSIGIVGSANGYYSGSYGKWTVLRRF